MLPLSPLQTGVLALLCCVCPAPLLALLFVLGLGVGALLLLQLLETEELGANMEPCLLPVAAGVTGVRAGEGGMPLVLQELQLPSKEVGLLLLLGLDCCKQTCKGRWHTGHQPRLHCTCLVDQCCTVCKPKNHVPSVAACISASAPTRQLLRAVDTLCALATCSDI